VPRPIDKDLLLGIREIARQTALIRRQYPMLSTGDIYSAIDWTGGKPIPTAAMLTRMNRQRTGPVDLRLFPQNRRKE